MTADASVDSCTGGSHSRPREITKTDIHHVAVRCLAMREHGYLELLNKLSRKGFDRKLTEEVLDRLAEAGLQSDERFAESFIRSRSQKAYGPVRIRAELQERGIDRGLTEKAFREANIDWLSVAQSWYDKRYAGSEIETQNDRSKRYAALLRRGFTPDVVRELLN